MKKLLTVLGFFLMFSLFVSRAEAAPVCVTIPEGELTYSSGHALYPNPLTIGFDVYGYNYQNRAFTGDYVNTYTGVDGLPPYTGDAVAYEAANPTVMGKWYWPYRDTFLHMKWNEAWLSNKDCDDDGKLDRHLGYPSYIGSGAWITNFMSGEYRNDNGQLCKWTYFTRIEAAPEGAVLRDGNWYTAEGVLIGPEIWSEFATVEERNKDVCQPTQEELRLLKPQRPEPEKLN